ncbi:MAG: transcriptional activator NhaR [Cystobacterineae bacterium]|nr:transcriptional activator NhaR [Cystobacterineae bacterium]
MTWLNYHHLFYFWTIARVGSIAKAGEELHLSQPTISTQLKTLEEALGHRLFHRQGRSLLLTESGRLVFKYADEIFRLGREMQKALGNKASMHRLRLSVGIADVIPKALAEYLLQPALKACEDIFLVCQEGPLPALLAQLAAHELDVVLSDRPSALEMRVKTFSHALGESGESFFAAPTLAAQLREGFPHSLEGAPALLPAAHTAVRRQLEAWFERLQLSPHPMAEFDDSALMSVFGQKGLGFFIAPSVLETQIQQQMKVEVFGRTVQVKERFFAVTVERKLKHPAILAMVNAAREQCFPLEC